MKSSTIRRSTLSKESMEVIEALAKEQDADGSFGEYVRPDEIVQAQDSGNKAQEIDLLWQTFKSTQFNTNSPTAYVLMGFVAGVVVTLILLFSINAFILQGSTSNSKFDLGKMFTIQKKLPEASIEEQAENVSGDESAKVLIPTEYDTQAPDSNVSAQQNESSEVKSETVDTSNMKKYIVKDGDTGESIIKRNYGSYSPERAERIMKVNNLKSLDRINIDQELWLPIE